MTVLTTADDCNSATAAAVVATLSLLGKGKEKRGGGGGWKVGDVCQYINVKITRQHTASTHTHNRILTENERHVLNHTLYLNVLDVK